MSDEAPSSDGPTCAPGQLEDLLRELARLREHMLEQADSLEPQLRLVCPAYRESALNLAHYLGLRQLDHRTGRHLGRIGRSQAHALAFLTNLSYAK